ncbi:ABZJ_00895 family protein [Shewanella waksmanii]|uniref:ABZJ_00895 family protein n=1 Tax=Shewanella waksmanii TaxID=213783 RepID=UPI0037354DEE
MTQQFTKYISRLPIALVIGVTLWLASMVMSIMLGVLQEIFGTSSTSGNVMTIVLPAMCVGLYLGQKTGVLISRKTRWQAIFYWTVFNLVAFALTLLTIESDLLIDLRQLGLFNLIFIIAMTVYLVLAYYCFKWGEKLGVNQHKKQASQ